MPFTKGDLELMAAEAQEDAAEAKALADASNEGIQFQDDGADLEGKGAVGTVNFVGFNVSAPSPGVLEVENVSTGGGMSATQIKQRNWF